MKEDHRIEQWLDANLVKYELSEVDVEQIDLASQELQNRDPDQDMDEKVAEYKAAYIRGDQMPPVVLWDIDGGNRRFVPIDGYTRCRSLREIPDRRFVEAYVVTAAERTAKRMALTANTRHGTGTSTSFRLLCAVQLIDSGDKHKDAAAALNLPADRVSQHYALTKADRRAGDMKVRRWHDLTDSAKVEVNRLRNDAAMRELAELAADAHWGGAILAKRQRELQAVAAERDQIETIRAWRDEVAAQTIDKAAKPPPRSLLRRSLTALNGVIKKIPAPELARMAITDEDKESLREISRQSVGYHQEVIECLDDGAH